MFIKKAIVKGVSAGVGLAAEAHAERKERKARSREPSPNPETSESSRHPFSHSKSSDEKDEKKKILSSDSESEDDDEQEWELDEAAAELVPPPPYQEEGTPVEPDMIAQDFVTAHHIKPNEALQEAKALPFPVILPQRRPKAKQRGFVRAYAPVLGECSGIEQATFMDFLQKFDKASQASPVFDVINLACFAVGFVGSPIAMAVTVAVQVASNTAKEVQSRYRRNTFLDDINETMFKPRGLYCMIMTYKPNEKAVIGMDVTSTDQALAKTLSEPESELRQKLKNIRLTSGKTQGEMSIPESAPLLYPAIDAAAANPSGEQENWFKSSGAFLGSYFDRRAHATYAATNPQSKLVAPESQREFKSPYADPNHPIHSGTLWGLLTAGKYDPVAKKRGRKAQRRAARRGILLTDEEIKNVEQGHRLSRERMGRRQGQGPVGLVVSGVRKVLTQDVLYLTIVNLPSESEMMEIRQELERAKSQ